MVRTYPFNPSTQAFGESLPCVRPLAVTHTVVRREAPFQADSYSGGRFDASLTKIAPSVPLPPMRLVDDEHDEGITVDASSRVNGVLPVVAKSIAQWNSNLSTVSTVVEDATTVLGIRCVRIDGQRFYQPVDIRSEQQLQQQQQTKQQLRHQKLTEADCGVSLSSTLSSFSSEVLGATRRRRAAAASEVAETGSQDSGYQCSLLDAVPVAACPMSERCRSDAFSAAISLLSGSSKSRHTIDEGTQTTHRSPRNASGKWRSVGDTLLAATLPAHHKSDFELARRVQERRPNFEMFDDWPMQNTIADGLSAVQTGKLALTFASAVNIPMASHKSSGDARLNAYGAFYNDPAYQLSALNLTQFGRSPEQKEQFAKEQHKLELLRQIEDNKRRKMLEKQREWEADERERVKNELYQQRVRLELEEEQRKEKEKELIAERKAQQRAAAQRAAAERLEEEKRQRRSPASRPAFEWWEKKRNVRDVSGGTHSPVIPALRATVDALPADERQLPRLAESGRSRQNAQNDSYNNGRNDKNNYKDVRTKANRSWRSRSFSNSTASYLSDESTVLPPWPLPRKRYDDRASVDTNWDWTAKTFSTASSHPIDKRTRPKARSHSRSNRRGGYRPSIEQSKSKFRHRARRLQVDNLSDAVRREYEDMRELTRGSNSPALRRLGMTRQTLRHEGKRVRDAIRANNYGAHLFDD